MTLNSRRHMPHLADESGQTMTEYSLLVALIALGLVALVPSVATGLLGFFSSVGSVFGV
jgi:Flp pilus assembly pilin Flp